MVITIYCSGGIKKGPHDDDKICWTDSERAQFAQGAHPAEVIFLEPADPVSDIDDALALFGRDMYQVQVADAVVVDGRQRRGIGVGVEMAVSRVLGTALIAVVPRETHYRRTHVSFRGGTAADYLHPHIVGLCDAVVEDFGAAGRWVVERVEAGSRAGDSGDAVRRGIDAYRKRLLPSDTPMLDAARQGRR